jgi:uncharacterized membrane protein
MPGNGSPAADIAGFSKAPGTGGGATGFICSQRTDIDMTDTNSIAASGGGDDAPHFAARSAEPSSEQQDRSETALATAIVTINRPRSEIYAFWRDFPNLANVMENVESITMRDSRTAHWAVSAPGDRTVEWDAIVTEDEQDRLIAWQSAEGADISNSGRVEFSDAGERGTIVTATIAYAPPGGAVGQFIAKLFQKEPVIQTRRDLRRLKQYLETGEIATSSPPNRAPKA